MNKKYLWIAGGLLVFALVFVALRSISGTGYNECWEGYDCGSGAEWLGGLFTGIAIYAGYKQFLRAEKTREAARLKDLVDRQKAICRVLIGDVLDVFLKSQRNLSEIYLPLGCEIELWLNKYRLQALEDLAAVRPQIMELGEEESVSVTQLYVYMRTTQALMKNLAAEISDARAENEMRVFIERREQLVQRLAFANIRQMALSAHATLDLLLKRAPQLFDINTVDKQYQWVVNHTKPANDFININLESTGVVE